MENNLDNHISDQDLLNIFLETRLPEDFEHLIRANIGRLQGVIYRIVLNIEDSEDLVQETFIKAYDKIDTFKGDAKFSTWLCQIGVNLAISFLRKRKPVQSINVELEESSFNTPDRIAESNAELDRIHQAISGLSEKLRSVIILSVIERMELKEIALVLKCPKATVYWRLHQARKILAKKLEVSYE